MKKRNFYFLVLEFFFFGQTFKLIIFNDNLLNNDSRSNHSIELIFIVNKRSENKYLNVVDF